SVPMLLLPIVASPAAAGLACLVVRSHRTMAWLGFAAYADTLALGVRLLPLVVANGVVTELGQFLSADALSAWMVLLISAVSLGTSLYAKRYFSRDLAAGMLTAGRVREVFVLTP